MRDKYDLEIMDYEISISIPLSGISDARFSVKMKSHHISKM